MCDLCGFVGAWMPRVSYGTALLRLCREHYLLYLRALYPAIYAAGDRLIRGLPEPVVLRRTA